MTERQPLTARQGELYAAIVRHVSEHCCGPTVRELAAALGIASPNGISGHLRAVAAKGWIVWEPVPMGSDGKAKARNIVVPELLAAVRAAAGALLEGAGDEAGGPGDARGAA